MNRNKKIALGAAGLVVLIGITWFAASKYRAYHRSGTTNNSQFPALNQSDIPPADLPTSTPSQPATRGGKSTAAYTKALETYQYRIQFSQCHGTSNLVGTGTLSVRQGSRFMLDNRDATAHTFAWKGGSVRIAGYSYAIETASALGTYPITCDGGGAAQLSVQS